jgi:hypothetical protein
MLIFKIAIFKTIRISKSIMWIANSPSYIKIRNASIKIRSIKIKLKESKNVIK